MSGRQPMVLLLAVHVLAALILPTGGNAQSAAQAGEILGREVQVKAGAAVKNTAAPGIVPGYAGSDFAGGELIEDPDALSHQGAAAANASTAARVVLDPRRLQIDPKSVDLTSAQRVEAAPDTFLGAGASLGGSKGQCQPLPASSEGNVTYHESCNDGTKVAQGARSCEVAMVARITNRPVFDYQCELSPGDTCDIFSSAISAGTCRVTGQKREQVCFKDDGEICSRPVLALIRTLECSAPVSAVPTPEPRVVTEPVLVPDERACTAVTAGATCTLDAQTCVDSEPATRAIEGVSWTQGCWQWRQDYTCSAATQANDCAELKANPYCAFDHQECLDDPEDGPCQVRDEVYRCTIPSGSDGPPASLCGSDLYCIHGECTTITREASTEFQDALIAVHALGDVRDQFDPTDLSLLKGEATGCHRPIFGLVNCCAGKSSGLLSAAAGGAALAGGPAAIAALATPFLTQFLCSAEEKTLDVKDRMGLCHYVGTYCSQKVLFVCTAKRKSYCCFPSKLSRLLQEQGRAQLGQGWGGAKRPQCRGFTVAEFQRLDLGKMDFREVYADFTAAVKLPDDVAASTAIQAKIRDYYQLHQASGQ